MGNGLKSATFGLSQAALGAASSILDHPDGTPGMLAKRETQRRQAFPHENAWRTHVSEQFCKGKLMKLIELLLKSPGSGAKRSVLNWVYSAPEAMPLPGGTVTSGTWRSSSRSASGRGAAWQTPRRSWRISTRSWQSCRASIGTPSGHGLEAVSHAFRMVSRGATRSGAGSAWRSSGKS